MDKNKKIIIFSIIGALVLLLCGTIPLLTWFVEMRVENVIRQTATKLTGSEMTIGEVSYETSTWFTGYDNKYFYGVGACYAAIDEKTSIIKYLYTQYDARTMGYPDFQMGEFDKDSYSYYKEIGISMNVARSEVFPIFKNKNPQYPKYF